MTSQATKADIQAAHDRGETLSSFEPLVLCAGSRHRKPLADLALEPTAASTGLKRSLPAGVVTALSTPAAFATFFLEVCLDQVRFMESLVEPGRLGERIVRWAADESRQGALSSQAGQVLEAVLFRGELPRGDAAALLGTGERNARRVMSARLSADMLASDSPSAPLRLAFPATLAGQWIPGLFPERRR